MYAGLIDRRGLRYCITRAGREELSRLDWPQDMPNPIMTREVYTGPKWNIREGGEKHKQYLSRGIG